MMLSRERQKRALETIYLFIQKYGISPSLADLRRALHFSSNQSILDLLSALESQGFIKRLRTRARGISLTHKGKQLFEKKKKKTDQRSDKMFPVLITAKYLSSFPFNEIEKLFLEFGLLKYSEQPYRQGFLKRIYKSKYDYAFKKLFPLTEREFINFVKFLGRKHRFREKKNLFNLLRIYFEHEKNDFYGLSASLKDRELRKLWIQIYEYRSNEQVFLRIEKIFNRYLVEKELPPDALGRKLVWLAKDLFRILKSLGKKKFLFSKSQLLRLLLLLDFILTLQIESNLRDKTESKVEKQKPLL